MSKKEKATLKQVAQLAGVSVAAASMILSQKEGVSFAPETVSKVRLAAKTLGYNRGSAGAIAGQGIFDKKVIAIFLPVITGGYYTSMVQAIDQAANQEGYDTICFESHRHEDRELRGLSYLSKCDVAGMIFTYIPHHYEMVEEIAKTTPVVVVGNRNQVLRLDMVETDNYRAGVLMARHMLELGHRHVAFLMTRRSWWGYASGQRLTGVEDTFARECPEAKLTVIEQRAGDTLAPGSLMPSRGIGTMLAERCFADSTITAMICIHDYVAYGALDAMAKHGYKAPEDYSICGCDDVFASSLPGVNLTTVNHHIYEKGTQAFDMLRRSILARAGGEESVSPVSITRVEFFSDLIVRGSTAAPKR